MRSILLRFLVVLCFASAATAHAASSGVAVRAVKGDFDAVRDRVVQTIEARGLVLNYTAKIGDMLERTGKDIGQARAVYARAELFEFCSAKVSRETMEADPHNIVFCPYAIAVYSLPKESGKVYVSYRKPQATGAASSVKALRAVEKLLADIVAEAAK